MLSLTGMDSTAKCYLEELDSNESQKKLNKALLIVSDVEPESFICLRVKSAVVPLEIISLLTG